MAFSMKRSPNDEKLFHKETMNVVTYGRGSYGNSFNLSIEFGNMNVLCGRFCSLAIGINFLIGGNHSMKSVSTAPFDVVVKEVFGAVRPNLRPLPNVRKNPRQVIIGNDVWIGRGATIMGGVKIGNGAVIGTNAVVAKDVPPYAIVVGNPARVIKYRFDEETVKKLLAVKWWNWDLEKIADNFPLMNDVEKFLETNYSPELEEFPEDEFTQKLNNLGVGKLSFHPRLRGEESSVA
jgi:virginiamycin A acetyltransferase